MCEPTRLAADYLADAYAQVVPLRHRTRKLLEPSSELVSEPRGVASVRRVES